MKHLDPDAIEQAARTPPEGELAAHLAACAECRGHVRDAAGRQRLLGGMTPYTLSEMAFRRVEARLDEAVAAGEAAPASWGWLAWVGGALAAAVLAFVLVGDGGALPGVVKIPRASPQVAAAPFHPLTVLKASGDAQTRQGDEPWRALPVGALLATGAALSAESLVLAPELPVAWAFQASGSLSLGGPASLTLGAGEVVAQVGAPVEVLAATRRMRASEALFAVSRVAAEVTLEVAEGEVEVTDSLTAERRVVKAPQALRWSDGSSLSSGQAFTLRTLRAPAVPARPWTRFDASGLLAGTEVSLDGVALGPAPFVELVTVGRRRLGLTPPGGALRESWVELIGGQPFAAKFEAPSLESDGPEPDAEALGRVMAALKAQRPKLAACYEKWLKANPQAEGEVVLELTVSAQGRVKRARVENGATVSAASAECLTTTARSLVLPPLGADATLQVPLVLRQPGR